MTKNKNMALIPNAGNWLTKGVNEVYGIASTGYNAPSASGGKTSALSAMVDKYKRDIQKAKDVAGGYILGPKAEASTITDLNTNNNNNGVWQGPIALNVPAKSNGGGSGTSSNDAKTLANIGRSWDNSGDMLNETKSSLNSSKNYINNLGKVRDQYQTSLDNYKNKTDEAIAGNKTLIQKDQKTALDDLAGSTRKEIDKTNIMLGVASGGSASKAFARKISEDAGKQRASVLTTQGDKMSYQNQAEKNALDDYNISMTHADEWVKTTRQQALDDYNQQEAALNRLKGKQSKYKADDIAAMSSQNLNNFIGSLKSIQDNAKNFQLNLNDKMSQYGGLSDALDTASVPIDAPAELATPNFSENFDINNPNASDWYDPTKTPTKKLKGYDALGNPIYEDVVPADTTTPAA